MNTYKVTGRRLISETHEVVAEDAAKAALAVKDEVQRNKKQGWITFETRIMEPGEVLDAP